MKVELIYFKGCPNVADARTLLIKAFAATNNQPKWSEWNQNDESCPEHYLNYGSPTILINSKDVDASGFQQQGQCCRLYFDKKTSRAQGGPELEKIINCMEKAQVKNMKNVTMTSRWLTFIMAIPSIFLALLPKLTCPMCWPAYTALFASLGIGFINYSPYVPIIIIGLLTISLFSLGYKASLRRGYLPFALGLFGSVSIFVSHILSLGSFMFYFGSVALIAAAIWNAWPIKKSSKHSLLCCRSVLLEEKYNESKSSN